MSESRERMVHRTEVSTLQKRRIIKDDGRYLIFYSFGKRADDETAPAAASYVGVRTPSGTAAQETTDAAPPLSPLRKTKTTSQQEKET